LPQATRKIVDKPKKAASTLNLISMTFVSSSCPSGFQVGS
jgi:hypothetical protein